MSDTTNSTDDPMAILLHERRAELVRRNEHNNARIEEIDIWLKAISDGRSTVSRQRKARTAGNSSAADGERLGNTASSQFHPDAAAGDGL